MKRLRIRLTEHEQRIVMNERESSPDSCVRRKLWVVWLLHCGTTRAKAAEIVGVARSTVERYVAEFREERLDGLLKPSARYKPTSELAKYAEIIRQSFTQRPVRTIAEACQRVTELTGVTRKPTQIRRFLKNLGLRWQRGRAVPVPPKKTLAEHAADQAAFLDERLMPKLDQAREGTGHVFFVDAAHFVYGTFLCCLWSFARIYVRAASGRQRFNVLGAWNAVARQLVAVTNTTVVNTDTMCELLAKISALELTGPITLVLDNARYQRNAVVQSLAESLRIELLFLPPYSPNLNLIERLWKFMKRRALYNRYHPSFADFRAAIEQTTADLPTKHAADLASLMTIKFQRFKDVSLMAA